MKLIFRGCLKAIKALWIVIGLCLATAGAINTAHAQVLPFPGDGSGAVFGVFLDPLGNPRQAILLNGIPIALRYDNFWSYSAPTLTALQGDGFIPSSTFGVYNFSVGVGTLDVVLNTQSGVSNTNVGPTGTFNFEDPAKSVAGNTTFFQNWWGQNDQNNDGIVDVPSVDGPVTIGNVLNYLLSFGTGNTIPVFFIDWNQQGAGDSILASAQVQIIDDVTGAVIFQFSLDTLNNSLFDQNAQTLNFGQISFLGDPVACAADPYNPLTGTGCAGVTANGSDYVDLDHNKGSGHPDFIIFSELLDLQALINGPLVDANDLFVVHAFVGCQSGTGIDGISRGVGCTNNGGEEIFLSGRLGIAQVPEPGTIALLGLGLLGILGVGTAARRRKI